METWFGCDRLFHTLLYMAEILMLMHGGGLPLKPTFLLSQADGEISTHHRLRCKADSFYPGSGLGSALTVTNVNGDVGGVQTTAAQQQHSEINIPRQSEQLQSKPRPSQSSDPEDSM